MRILTVRQPWAWAIIHGGKNVENRVRNIAGGYRGPVAIHVAGKFATDGLDLPALVDACDDWCEAVECCFPDLDLHPWSRHVGKIIGVVDLIDVHGVMMTNGRWHCEHTEAPVHPGASGACSRWADLGALHLFLAKPRPLRNPIPFTGALGLRRLDQSTIDRITAQLVSPPSSSCSPSLSWTHRRPPKGTT